MARQISFVAASPVGKEPLIFSVFRSTRFSGSKAVVVYHQPPHSGGGIIACQLPALARDFRCGGRFRL